MRRVDKPVDKWSEPRGNVDNPGERLQKYLAHAGVASRRHAEALIAAGAVTVNGQVVTALGTRIDPAQDVVLVNGQAVQATTAHITVAIHKPIGMVATVSDPQGRAIVTDLLPQHLRTQHLVPVGRLDADSEGLLLLSNDGDLTLRLTHPRYGATKEYHALVEGEVSDGDLQRLRQGVVLAGADERPTAPAVVWRLRNVYGTPPDQQWIGVILHEGRKRQVRLMFAAIGARVTRLIRARIGQLTLADIVPAPGAWHVLTEEEIARAQQK